MPIARQIRPLVHGLSVRYLFHAGLFGVLSELQVEPYQHQRYWTNLQCMLYTLKRTICVMVILLAVVPKYREWEMTDVN